MPYDSETDLPDSVTDNLPVPAQEIYKEAFDTSFEQYKHDEERAHRIAWGAVKRAYHKNDDGEWVEGATELG